MVKNKIMGSVRFASPNDADQIVEIFRSSFQSAILSYTILGCHGIKQFILDGINHQVFKNHALFVVSADGEFIQGAAEFRRDISKIFLNHIYVRESERGRGIGRQLLFDGLQLVRDLEQNTIELDVFFDNHDVKRWYESLGMAFVSENLWIETSIVPPETNDKFWWVTNGLPEADQIHRIYGFSQFTVKTAKNTYPIGRLGLSLFRIVGSERLDDFPLLNALTVISPDRKVLLIGSFAKYLKESRVITRSQRLSGSVDKLLSQLAPTRTH